MNDPECTLGFVHCERVTDWPTGGTLVTLLVLLVVAGWVFWRSR